MLSELEKNKEKQTQGSKSKIEVLNHQISRLAQRVKTLSLMRADGEMEKEEYLRAKQDTQEAIQAKEQELLLLEDTGSSWEQEVKKHLDLCSSASEILQNGDILTIQSLLRKFGSNQVLLDGKLYITKGNTLLAIQEAYQRYRAKKCKVRTKKSPCKTRRF